MVYIESERPLIMCTCQSSYQSQNTHQCLVFSPDHLSHVCTFVELLHAASFHQQVEVRDPMMMLKMTTHITVNFPRIACTAALCCSACAGQPGVVGTLAAKQARI